MAARLVLICASLVIPAAGCAPSGLQRVAVDGEVTIDSQPVNNASIVFTPTAEGTASIAAIHEGKFSIPQEIGPTAGDYWIRLNPESGSGGEETPTAAHGKKGTRSIPVRFQSNGDLKVNVPSQAKTQLNFHLKTK